MSEVLQISRANVSTLHRSKGKVLREGDHPYSISGHFGTVFIEECVLRVKVMGDLLGSDRCSLKVVRVRLCLGGLCESK